MPTVPRYEPGQIDNRPVSGATLDVSTPLDNPVARGVEDIGHAGVAVQTDIMEKERRKQDQLRALDAANSLNEIERQKLYDPDTGALNTQGKDALGLREKVLPEFDKAAGQMLSQAANDEQRLTLQRMIQDKRNDIDRSLELHTAQQMKVFDAQTTDATVKGAQDAAIANFQDPERVAKEIAKQQAIIADHAKRTGLPPEWVALKRAQAATETHTGVIDQLLANDQDQAASAYYAQHKDEIAGSAQAQIQKALDISSTRGASQKASDDIVLHSADPVEALNKAEAIEDPKLRDATVARVQGHYQQQEEARAASQKLSYQDAESQLQAAGGDLTKVNPVTLAALDLDHRENLNVRAKQLMMGDPVVTDPEVKYNLRSLATADETKAEFAKMDLLPYRTKLSPADFDIVSGWQGEARKELSGKESKPLAGVSSHHDIAEQALLAVGINPAMNKGNNDAPRVARFMAQLDRAVIAQEAETKKPVPGDDVRKIADRLLIDQQVQQTRSIANPARWFGDKTTAGTVKAFEVPGADKTAFSSAQVPAAERAKIIEAFQNAGGRPTEQQIVDTYNKQVLRTANAQ